MPELLDRPEDGSSDDSDDESVPATCCKYGIWNLEGIKSYQKKIQRKTLRHETDESENSIEES
jgi:hypothetical protein